MIVDMQGTGGQLLGEKTPKYCTLRIGLLVSEFSLNLPFSVVCPKNEAFRDDAQLYQFRTYAA